MPHTSRYSQIALAIVLLGGTFSHAPAASAQATTLHDAATQLTKELGDDPDVQKMTGEHIVIAPFENINGKGDAVPRILQEMFTTDFIKAKHFKVLERDQLQSALDELHFQLSDLADPAKAKKIGKLAGATYVLLGSISDTGNSTSINARIVSIESGESVAAEDEDIKTGDTPLAVSGLNSASTPDVAVPITAPVTSPDVPAPVDLNAKANPTSAGQFTGKKEEFGLLGNTNLQIVWREDLGKEPIFSFAAGDVLGNGSSRLVLGKPASLSIQRWDDSHFIQTWVGSTYTGDGFVRVLPQIKLPARIFLSDKSHFNTSSWLWDGTNYSRQGLFGCVYDVCASVPETLVGMKGENTGLMKSSTSSMNDGNGLVPYKGFIENYGFEEMAAADFDGDGNTELATTRATGAQSGSANFSPFANAIDADRPIEIYSLAAVRKAVTTKGYGERLAVWQPMASKHPFLVAQRNIADADGKPSGGFVYLIQWNGESYDEVWKSNQIGDAVIDMQVCDPKGEGKTGLVILSRQDKNYFLTKIVLAK